MDVVFLKSHRFHLSTLALSLVIVLLFTSVSFAADDKDSGLDAEKSQVSTGQDLSESNNIDPGSDSLTDGPDEVSLIEYNIISPRPITAGEILKYSKYKKKNAKRIPVITYHRIVSNKAKKSPQYKHDKWTVSQRNFKKQMKWLKKKHYRTISCDELYLWYMGKIKLPKRSVLITFDDGYSEAIERALPVLKKYKMKGTAFIIGSATRKAGSTVFISEGRIRQIQREYPKFEFQSHTYNMHKTQAVSADYGTIMDDAALQRDAYGFDYLAFPYGKKSAAMLQAYKDSGIRMAFSFGDFGFATRKQDSFRIKRFAVKGNTTLRKFKKWCR